MKVFSRDFIDMGRLPLECTFGTFERFPNGGRDRFKVRENRNPSLRWVAVPPESKSIVVICDDLDAADVSQADWASGTLPKDIKKRELCHWMLIDCPVDSGGIAKGEFSDGVFLGGKPGPESHYGSRQGRNSMTEFFADDLMMKGDYFGYDGPCPPFGAQPHRYRFAVYAVKVEMLSGVKGAFTREDVFAAMKGLILAEASIIGCF
ncbi:YbhB/YbcL family Raf kinase inhibitor-like protein [Caballeronia sp. 15711]|uniref:YbhB/YbcL family Raf kinase inhibitor-like protein n=1 Tax=Caballeronia sp. 15711 TaxID=3391029 RepID=UPI0039E4877F